jgi:aspartate/glutamate racemase
MITRLKVALHGIRLVGLANTGRALLNSFYRDRLDARHAPPVVSNETEKRGEIISTCLLYTSPSPRDRQKSRMPSSA